MPTVSAKRFSLVTGTNCTFRAGFIVHLCVALGGEIVPTFDSDQVVE
jgi:hypothetical protein